MQQTLGEILRQVRRQRNLTQQELAGDRFSKSYVSAVENNRIKPSPEALRFFAERLGQTNGIFTALLQQAATSKQLSVLNAPPLPVTTGQIKQDDTLTLLDTVLEQMDFTHSSPPHDLPLLAPDVLTSFPQHMQARYYFLMGLNAKEKRDLPVALRAFESALALAPSHQQAAILDEIGSTYFLMQAPLTALGYHLHALHLLSKASSNPASASLHLKVELHCGDAYRQLGAYQPALEHYEPARKHLTAQHDLETAGQLFSGLGYCTYAVIYPATARFTSSVRQSSAMPEQIEREFQKAISFLLQSKSFYQVIGDRLREANVCLLLASIFLDLSTWRLRMAHERARNAEKKESFTNCLALLDDAEEQCRQVLLGWQSPDEQAQTPLELDTILYAALALLIRISVQRALLARLDGNYIDAAYRERAFAAYLCRQVLDTLSSPSLPWPLIQQALNSSADTLEYRPPTLPHLTDMPLAFSDASSPHSPLSQVEVYFTVGEVAEELGRTAALYTHDFYVQANQYFQAALSMAHSALLVEGKQDPGYLARLYLRCATLLEERAFASPDLYEETTKVFLGVLKDGFWQLQSLLPEKKPWHMQGNGGRTTE
jgi:tetratricopeptide (TPR) repeat protein